MPKIQDAIIVAILQAMLDSPGLQTFVSRLWMFFNITRLPLERFQPELFEELRNDVWEIDEKDYRGSFELQNDDGELTLRPLSELGFSGSVGSL